MKKTLLINHMKIKAFLVVLIGFLYMFLFSSITSFAANDDFEISVNALSSNGSDTADIQFTVTNKGENFEGTARLLAAQDYNSTTAFDEDLSLASGATKQFVISLPSEYLNRSNNVYFELIDRKNKPVFESDYSSSIFNATSSLSVGILSDNYNALTFFDLSGTSIEYGSGNYYHLKTVEINKTNLVTELPSLSFLVIDNYNTSVLSDDDFYAINDWLTTGGSLILGSGSHASQVFSDNMSLLCDTNVVPHNNRSIPAIFGDLQPAYFDDPNYIYDSFDYLASLHKGHANGSISIFQYSFTDIAGLTMNELNGWNVNDITEEIITHAINYNSYVDRSHRYNDDDYEYQFFPILHAKDNNLNLGITKIVIIVYLFVISPLLYFILKKKNKQEIYWISIPALSLVFVLLIYITGMGVTVTKTRVYSVTIADAAGKMDAKGAMYCYDSHKKEWNLNMKNTVESVAPFGNNWYSYGMAVQDSKYSYHIGHRQGELFAAYQPDSPFDEAYFRFKGTNQESGGLLYENGVITNNTGKDLAYVCVLNNSYPQGFDIYENLPNGQTLSISDPMLINQTFSDNPEYELRSSIASLFSSNYYNKKPYKSPHATALPALAYGLCNVQSTIPEDTVLIMGVVENYYPTVNSQCSEKSYGCLYSLYSSPNGGASNVIY